jgi:hypothetical protein
MGIILGSVLVVKWDEIDCLWAEPKLSGGVVFRQETLLIRRRIFEMD